MKFDLKPSFLRDQIRKTVTAIIWEEDVLILMVRQESRATGVTEEEMQDYPVKNSLKGLKLYNGFTPTLFFSLHFLEM